MGIMCFDFTYSECIVRTSTGAVFDDNTGWSTPRNSPRACHSDAATSSERVLPNLRLLLSRITYCHPSLQQVQIVQQHIPAITQDIPSCTPRRRACLNNRSLTPFSTGASARSASRPAPSTCRSSITTRPPASPTPACPHYSTIPNSPRRARVNRSQLVSSITR